VGIPERLTPKQRALLEELANQDDVRPHIASRFRLAELVSKRA